MPTERRQLRGVVLTEDKRTERFLRYLLEALGFRARNFEFHSAPKGSGAGEAWVRMRYPKEVKALRSQNFQRGLRLIAVLDGDTVGAATRKKELDRALEDQELDVRKPTDRIATPIPTRNIETWLLCLLGKPDLDETRDYKKGFEKQHSGRERAAISEAVSAWRQMSKNALPSLLDGKEEMRRLDP
jgi:hypothetical protein